MGQDCSYTQPSSSEAYEEYTVDGYSQDEDFLEDQAESVFNNSVGVQYSDVEFGFPKSCYCGAEPLVATSYTRNDPDRRFYTCENRDDGDCHVWKWWDVAAMEEIKAIESHIGQLAEKVDYLSGSSHLEEIKPLHIDTEVKLTKIVSELAEKKSRLELVIGLMAIVFGMLGLVIIYH